MAQSRVDTIIGGGKVVTSSEVFDAAIAIVGEEIAAIGPEHLLPPADRYIDASGKVRAAGADRRSRAPGPGGHLRVGVDCRRTFGDNDAHPVSALTTTRRSRPCRRPSTTTGRRSTARRCWTSGSTSY